LARFSPNCLTLPGSIRMSPSIGNFRVEKGLRIAMTARPQLATLNRSQLRLEARSERLTADGRNTVAEETTLNPARQYNYLSDLHFTILASESKSLEPLCPSLANCPCCPSSPLPSAFVPVKTSIRIAKFRTTFVTSARLLQAENN
jgi:hypothetical protein